LIHGRSSRKDKPFLAVNCAAVNQLLAESAFFGHRKGSFTGAEDERTGYFRAADGGTLFLDEIGDLSLALQAKLLQVLEDGMILPLGYDHAVKVDVRLLAATNRNLEEMIGEGSFRRDLFERINTVTLELPPLRERTDDIPDLSALFLEDWNRSYHEAKFFSEAVLKYFIDYPWPGNVRELQNAVQSMAALGRSPNALLDADLLPPNILIYFNQGRDRPEVDIDIPRDGINLKAWLFQMEKRFYMKALERSGGNKEEAAELLQLNAPAFRKALRERFNEAD
jgi:transcriptional regulator with PAS, ATPase and Fis domain